MVGLTRDTPNPREQANYLMKVVSFNIRQLLSAKGETQTDLAKYIGIKQSGLSLKISRANWGFDEVLLAASYLGTSIEKLMDDTVMRMLTGEGAS